MEKNSKNGKRNYPIQRYAYKFCFFTNTFDTYPTFLIHFVRASKCTKAFSHRNITVTTKHTYTIAYKYVWVCEACETEYKRHSKSIDPAKHTCGKCKGKLVQVQPAPRKGQSEGKRSEYQDFVKKEHERVKLENPGKGFGERMAILGREFRESKKAGGVGEGPKEKQLVSEVPKQEVKDDDIDAVVRKLDFVHLTE